MAKKELNFGKLSLPTKAVIIKKEEDTVPMIEKAIEKIHGEATAPKVAVAPIVVATPAPVVAKVEEPVVDFSKKTVVKKAEVIELDEMIPVKKISMDLPLDVYKYLKINSFDKAMTMKDYVLRLIEADMKKNRK
jgi:peroxiredoxin